MKKHFAFSLALSFSLLLCSCGETPTPDSPLREFSSSVASTEELNSIIEPTTVIPAVDNHPDVSDIILGSIIEGTAYLGMPKADVFQLMQKEKLELLPAIEDNPDEMYADDGAVLKSYGSETVAIYVTRSYSFTIDDNGELIAINVHNNPNFSTAAGLKLGDTKETMIEIYGKHYETRYNDYGDPYYQYNIDGRYIMIGIQFDIIVAIRFSEFDRW